jgi:membrane protease YdiL (CAAX protease family)
MGLLTAMQIAFAILFGISMAFIVIKTDSVIFPIAYHFLFDFSQVITTSPGATNTSESSLNIYSLAVLVISSLALVGYCVWMAKTQPDVVTE